MVHMAGHKDANKQELFKYCFDLAQKEGESGRESAMGGNGARNPRRQTLIRGLTRLGAP